jgi:ankyrin repeat protein
LFWPAGLADGRVHVRAWLMDGGELDFLDEAGRPLWATAMLAGHPEAVDELIAAGANLNLRDHRGNGWLHWAITTGQRASLTLMGMAQLGPDWWLPNARGQTPFHLTTTIPDVAQAMGARFWAEGGRWARLQAGGDPIDLAREAGAPALERAWRACRQRCGSP